MIRPWVKLDGKFRQVKKTVRRTVLKQSEIAPNFKKSSENPFQDALARKDYVKAKKYFGKYG